MSEPAFSGDKHGPKTCARAPGLPVADRADRMNLARTLAVSAAGMAAHTRRLRLAIQDRMAPPAQEFAEAADSPRLPAPHRLAQTPDRREAERTAIANRAVVHTARSRLTRTIGLLTRA